MIDTDGNAIDTSEFFGRRGAAAEAEAEADEVDDDADESDEDGEPEAEPRAPHARHDAVSERAHFQGCVRSKQWAQLVRVVHTELERKQVIPYEQSE